AEFQYRLSGAVRSRPVYLSLMFVPQFRLDLLGITQSFYELQGQRSRTPILILWRHSEPKILAPIQERPPRNLSQQPISPLSLQKPIEHTSNSWHLRADEVCILAIHPEIMHHADPQ